MKKKFINELIARRIFEAIFHQNFPKSHSFWLISDIGKKLELDGYCEILKLAFEYQGSQHFKYSNFFKGNLNRQQYLDELKQKLCDAHGITLIIIPYTITGYKIYDCIVEKCREKGVIIPEHSIDLHELISKIEEENEKTLRLLIQDLAKFTAIDTRTIHKKFFFDMTFKTCTAHLLNLQKQGRIELDDFTHHPEKRRVCLSKKEFYKISPDVRKEQSLQNPFNKCTFDANHETNFAEFVYSFPYEIIHSKTAYKLRCEHGKLSQIRKVPTSPDGQILFYLSGETLYSCYVKFDNTYAGQRKLDLLNRLNRMDFPVLYIFSNKRRYKNTKRMDEYKNIWFIMENQIQSINVLHFIKTSKTKTKYIFRE